MGEVTYVRRVAGGAYLTYHDSRCHHVRDRDDLTEVSVEEVRAAAGRRWTHVIFEGRTRVLNVCGVCVPRRPTWPPEEIG